MPCNVQDDGCFIIIIICLRRLFIRRKNMQQLASFFYELKYFPISNIYLIIKNEMDVGLE